MLWPKMRFAGANVNQSICEKLFPQQWGKASTHLTLGSGPLKDSLRENYTGKASLFLQHTIHLMPSLGLMSEEVGEAGGGGVLLACLILKCLAPLTPLLRVELVPL